MSLSLAPKLLDLTDKLSSYPRLDLDEIGAPLLPIGLDNTILNPQMSETVATPIESTTAPLKSVIEKQVSCSFQTSSSPQLVERFVGSKSLLGPNCTSRNTIVSEMPAEGLSVPIVPRPLGTRALPWLSQI